MDGNRPVLKHFFVTLQNVRDKVKIQEEKQMLVTKGQL